MNYEYCQSLTLKIFLYNILRRILLVFHIVQNTSTEALYIFYLKGYFSLFYLVWYFKIQGLYFSFVLVN